MIPSSVTSFMLVMLPKPMYDIVRRTPDTEAQGI